MKKISCILLASLAIAGCTDQQVGTVAGSVVGGVIGKELGGRNNTAAIIAGSIIGGHIGGQIGKSMGNHSRQNMANTLESGRSNNRSTWVDPDTGYTYSMVPKKSYHSNHKVCRRFTMSVNMNGRYENTHGVACRHNGRWVIQ